MPWHKQGGTTISVKKQLMPKKLKVKCSQNEVDNTDRHHTNDLDLQPLTSTTNTLCLPAPLQPPICSSLPLFFTN